MVFLERSPYGPTWAYFEYERTARGEARVGRKLNGDGCPVLIVCWNDDAESVFQRLGSGMGIPLLTTTIKRTSNQQYLRSSDTSLHQDVNTS